MKFILIGDRHNSESKPENRTDDYLATTENKDNEIIDMAIKLGVSAVIHAGDFWTDGDKKMKNEYVSKIANRWQRLTNKGIPLLGIAGNHDLFGNNIRSLPHTTIGFLDAVGMFELVSKEKPKVFTENGKTVKITGSNYHHGTDKKGNTSDYIVDEKDTDFHIHVVHGMLSPKNLGKMITHTSVDSIVKTKADVTFCGHDHIGFDTLEVDGKYFVNPGALVRIKNDKREISRRIKIVVLTIDDKGITLEDVYLKSAPDGLKVLDREKIEKKKEKEMAKEELKSQIKQLGVEKKIKIDDILQDIYENKGVSKEIREDIQKRLSEKTVENAFSGILAKDAEIETLTLKNYMSHSYTVIDFSDFLNVILGESRQGKTTLLRALRWIYENKPTGDSMIRHGETYASASVKLKNGTIITREIGEKINTLKIIHPDGKVEEGNTKMLPRVQEVLGFRDMKIDSKLSFPINFMRQGSGWYLIGDTTGTERARILGSLRNTNACDAVSKDFDKEISQHKKTHTTNVEDVNTLFFEIEETNKKKMELTKVKKILEMKMLIAEINKYKENLVVYESDTLKLKEITDNFNEEEIKTRIESLKSIVERHEIITQNKENIIASKETIIEQSKIIDITDAFIAHEKSISRLKETSNKLEEVIDNLSTVSKEKKKIVQISEYLVKLDTTVSESNISKIKEKLLRLEEVENLNIQIKSDAENIKIQEDIITKTNVSEDLETKNKQLKDLMVRLEETEKLQNEIVKLKDDVSNGEAKISKINIELEGLGKAKLKTLIDSKICPTCYGTVDEHNLVHIIDELKN